MTDKFSYDNWKKQLRDKLINKPVVGSKSVLDSLRLKAQARKPKV